jgi:hypothetical protein
LRASNRLRYLHWALKRAIEESTPMLVEYCATEIFKEHGESRAPLFREHKFAWYAERVHAGDVRHPLQTAEALVLAARFRRPWLVVLGILAIPVLWREMERVQYALLRLTSFLDPGAAPAEAHYQLRQSLIAVGSGRLFGVGYGEGRQQTGFLPYPFNDFIASNIGEEWGFLGLLLLVAGLALLAMANTLVSCGDRYQTNGASAAPQGAPQQDRNDAPQQELGQALEAELSGEIAATVDQELATEISSQAFDLGPGPSEARAGEGERAGRGDDGQIIR